MGEAPSSNPASRSDGGPDRRSSSPRARHERLRHAIAWTAAALTASLAPHPTSASHLPPWVAPGDTPLPPWVKSVRILKADQPLLRAASGAAPRRGSAARDVRLPVFAA